MRNVFFFTKNKCSITSGNIFIENKLFYQLTRITFNIDLKNYCFSNTFPKVPQNGVLKLSNGGDPFTKNDFEIGEKVYFECNSGKSEGESFTTCQQNGFFSEADFKCSDDDGNDDGKLYW